MSTAQLSNSCCVPSPSHPRYDHPKNMCRRVHILNLFTSFLGPRVLHRTLFSVTVNLLRLWKLVVSPVIISVSGELTNYIFSVWECEYNVKLAASRNQNLNQWRHSPKILVWYLSNLDVTEACEVRSHLNDSELEAKYCLRNEMLIREHVCSKII